MLETSETETNAPGGKMTWVCLKEVVRQFFYGAVCVFYAGLWMIAVALILTWGKAPSLILVKPLIYLAILATAITSVSSFIFESADKIKEFADEQKKLASRLTLIELGNWLVICCRAMRGWDRIG